MTIAIERSIWIDASIDRVWTALTDPQQIAVWFAPGTTFKVSGNEVGARLYIEDPETGAEMYVQIMEVYDPPHQLMMRSQVEPPETPFTTHYTLHPENSGTRLTLIFSGYEGLPEEMRQPTMTDNEQGFTAMLDNIKAFIEGTEMPRPGGF